MSEQSEQSVDVAVLGKMARAVGEQHAEREAAADSVRDHEIELLTTILEAVQPAMKALAGRIQRYEYDTTGSNGCAHTHKEEYFSERGVLLIDDYTREYIHDRNRGSLEGECLYLLADGCLAETVRGGDWSCWQGEVDMWEATLSRCTIAEALAAGWQFDDIVAGLHARLREQLTGASATRTKTLQARTLKLQAIRQLL